MTITTHAPTRPAPLADRIAAIRREARGDVKPRERWDCGLAGHEHRTKAEALACIDGVLTPKGYVAPTASEMMDDREREIMLGDPGYDDKPVGVLLNPAKRP